MKKVFLLCASLTVTLTMLLSAAVCPVAAAADSEPSSVSLLALGDSLTTGYGLDNYSYGGDPYLCDSYINRIAAAMGLQGGETYINHAVNGDRSGDLARLIPSLENEIKAADMIIITIGGNDLLGVLPSVAQRLSGKPVSDFAQAAQILATASAEDYEALRHDPVFAAQMKSLLEDLAVNLQTIAGFIKETSPEARVIFLKQYNPAKNVPGLAAFGEFGGGFLDSINSTLESAAAAFGYETVDIPSVIDGRAALLTNILSYDIHPNAQGHLEIAKAVARHLGLSLGLPEETEAPAETSAEPATDAPTEPANDASTGPATQAPADEPTDASTDPATPVEKKGCSASAGVLLVVLAAVCAAVSLKKTR